MTIFVFKYLLSSIFRPTIVMKKTNNKNRAFVNCRWELGERKLKWHITHSGQLGARAQFPPKLSLNELLNFRKFSPQNVQSEDGRWKVKLYTSLMTREFTNAHPQKLPACNFLSQYYFYNIFWQKSPRFSFQILTKFETAKTGSGVGVLLLTAVCVGISWATACRWQTL